MKKANKINAEHKMADKKNEEHKKNKCRKQKSRVLHGYLCIHRSPRDPMLIRIVCNHFARAAGKLLRCECLFLMRFFNYLARAAATIFLNMYLFFLKIVQKMIKKS